MKKIILSFLIVFLLTDISVGEEKKGFEGMVFIKGGCFEMGDQFGEGDSDEKPVHGVCVDDFYMGEHEVTVGEFREFVNETAYKTEAEKGKGCFYWTGSQLKMFRSIYWDNPDFSQTEENPVTCVSWNDATEYIKWKKKKTGLNYRLPTEAEWEYAMREGGKSRRFAGFSKEGDLFLYANFCDVNCSFAWKTNDQNDGYQYTAAVKSYRPNSLGLYDMSGNVWEWVLDWYDKDYYNHSLGYNLTGPRSGKYRVLRGGSWSSRILFVRAAFRPKWAQIGLDTGFRLAQDNKRKRGLWK